MLIFVLIKGSSTLSDARGKNQQGPVFSVLVVHNRDKFWEFDMQMKPRFQNRLQQATATHVQEQPLPLLSPRTPTEES